MKRTPLRRESKKRRAQRQARREAVSVALQRAPYCQASLIWPETRCWGPLHPHEPLSRGRGGSITDPDNIVMICAGHHAAVHDNPRLATERGLLRSSWD